MITKSLWWIWYLCCYEPKHCADISSISTANPPGQNDSHKPPFVIAPHKAGADGGASPRITTYKIIVI